MVSAASCHDPALSPGLDAPYRARDYGEKPVRRRALLCGLSTRGLGLFLKPALGLAASGKGDFDLSQYLDIVGIIDPDRERVAAFNERFQQRIPSYTPSQWEQALEKARPDTALVTVPDHLHEEYILRSLGRRLNVITEKPMVISCRQARRVLAAERESGAKIQVAFNYRYHPLHAKIKEFLDSGRLGKIVQVDFNWCLDSLHGASYFYRWNRIRKLSGSLAVHKCCHCFDLIRWMIRQDPVRVTALGGLDFYGPRSGHRPGGRLGNKECPYLAKWFGNGGPEDDDHPIYHLQGDEGLPFPQQYPQRLSIYDEEIDIEDNYSALIQYDRGAKMTFSVNFSCPWEGYNLAINGDLGRLEIRHFMAPKRCSFPAESRAAFLPIFGEMEELQWTASDGGHGGADLAMLKAIFTRDAEPSPLATSLDGMLAVATGEAMWRSVVEKRTIHLEELLKESV